MNWVEDSARLRRILQENRVVAVVGLSADPMRPSFFAAKYLQDHGFRIIPVNPRYDTVLGEKCYASLEEILEPVGLVDIFQRSERAEQFVEQAIRIDARVVWMQLGIVNENAAEKARAAGLEVVMNRCVKIEYARLFGGLNLVGVNTRMISSRRSLTIVH